MTAFVDSVESVRLNGVVNVLLRIEKFTSGEKPVRPDVAFGAFGVGVS